MRLTATIGALFCLIGPCFAQGPESSTATLNPSGGVAYEATFSFYPIPFENTLVAAAPYSAEEVSFDGEQPRLLRKVYRNSKGAIRVERQLNFGPNVQNAPLVIEISDFEKNLQYVLDTQAKIAHRYLAPAPGALLPMTAESATESMVASAAGVRSAPREQGITATPSGPKTATLPLPPPSPPQDLGAAEIDGLRVDRKRSEAAEVWFSPELKIVVFSKTIDPQGTERIVRLRNINRTEPDPRLFQIPSDYKVQDERGTFRIRAVIAQ
jgi:hypothetical protein